MTTDAINEALSSGGDVKIGNLTQGSDAGLIVIPKGANVDLAGSLKLYAGGTLIVVDTTSIKSGSNGTIDATETGATAVVPPDLISKVTGTSVSIAETINKDLGTIAVAGDITIGGTTGTTSITPADLAAKPLYVIGSLAVSAPITGAAKITVVGNATVNASASGNVTWTVTGILDVSQAGAPITLSTSNAVKVGTLKTADTVVISTGSGGLTFGNVVGSAKFAASAKIGGGTFGGPVSFAGTVNLASGVTFGDDVTLPVGANALTFDTTNPVILTGGSSIYAGTSAVLKAGAELRITPTANATLTASTANAITVGGQPIAITSGELIVGAGKELVASVDITVTNPDGKFTLAGGVTGGKLSGSGSVKAGSTVITGGTAGNWTASGTGITISAASGTVSTIAALSGGTGTLTAAVTTAGEAKITQSATANNNLIIEADTTIALGGSTTVVGEIVLLNSAATNTTANGKLTLLGTITTGNTAGTTPAAPLSTDSATEVATTTTYTKIGVLLLTGDGVNAKVVPTNAPATATTSVAGKIVSLIGGTGATITGGDSSTTVDGTVDGKISSATATVADAT
jgi:hypothetical protein